MSREVRMSPFKKGLICGSVLGILIGYILAKIAIHFFL